MKKFKTLVAVSLTLAASLMLCNQVEAQTNKKLSVVCSQFRPGEKMSATDSAGNTVTFVLKERDHVPATQQNVRNDAKSIHAARQKVNPNTPFYTIRMALPIPSCYTPTEQGGYVGMDEGVYAHLHSVGLEALPNGDMLAIYFSTPIGKSESDTCTTFVQCRLRAGSDIWDMPELFFDTKNGNDQSALLFRDGNRIWFFGGGRDISDMVPFRICYSDDCGATWTFTLPQLDAPARDYTAQPVTNAFRDGKGNMYIVMDGQGAHSFLWRSSDNGKTWHDMGGRTDTRHSSIVPLNKKGTLLCIGGKNNDNNGWNPANISHNWGATWEKAPHDIIPALGTAQRPCIIRLKSGNLLFVTDSYRHKKHLAPPEDWHYGNECVVGLSRDNGRTWIIKELPGTLPPHHRPDHSSLGYVCVRQADNGRIHVLTTTNYPALDIEFNEAWIFSDKGDLTSYNAPVPATEIWTQYWPNGHKRIESTWSLWTTPRDGSRPIRGRIAEGPARHYDQKGNLIREYRFHKGVMEGTEKMNVGAGIRNEGK